jgi:formate hydrogenlyase subunit 6/NADH:ubiquinone oxidoreductase subunit I
MPKVKPTVIRKYHYHIKAKKCVSCGICAKKCPAHCISGELEKVYVIDQSKCIACGSCYRICPEKAVKHKKIELQAQLELSDPKKMKHHYIYHVKSEKCVSCGKCAKKCPMKCIDGKHKKPYEIDGSRCIACGACYKKCPHHAIAREEVKQAD